MREYKYCAVLHTEDGTDTDFVFHVFGINKENAVENIKTLLPQLVYSVKSIVRINITDRKRNGKSQSMAFVDMGQCF